jgi:FkbM family methyltransferase
MYASQDHQDKYLEENVFKGYKRGIFVDVGAHDGVSINNTLYFEKYNGWTGINVEPIKEVYDKLVVNRPSSVNINCAVCNFDGTTDFLCNKGYTEMISGIKDTFDSRHLQRLQRENTQTGSTTTIIQVHTKKLETIFEEHKLSHINYLSIDVEGAEFEVVKSIQFDKVFIDVIGFENNFEDTGIHIIKYLESKNYVLIHKSLDIFMIHKNSVFFRQPIKFQLLM